VDVTVLDDLKAHTRAHHRALEDQLKLPQSIASRRDLSVILAALLAAWHPLERCLATACDWAEVGLDPHLGEATTLLRDDLGALAPVSAPDPRVPAVPPPFDTTARAAGGRYVLLGSAMGGRVLAPAIERRLGPGTDAATRFFRRAGLDPRRDWRAFQTAMTSRVWSRREAEQVVGSARATFEFIAGTARPLLLLDGDSGR
jgi:heme oxygenase